MREICGPAGEYAVSDGRFMVGRDAPPLIDPGVRGGEGCLKMFSMSKEIEPGDVFYSALHDFFKVAEETESLQMHVHYLPGIRNAIALLVAGTRCCYGGRAHCSAKATTRFKTKQSEAASTPDHQESGNFGSAFCRAFSSQHSLSFTCCL